MNYEYPVAAGFRFLLISPLPSKKKCPEGRNKTIYMNLDVRYGIFEGGSNRQTNLAIPLLRTKFSSHTIISMKYHYKFELHIYSSTQ